MNKQEVDPESPAEKPERQKYLRRAYLLPLFFLLLTLVLFLLMIWLPAWQRSSLINVIRTVLILIGGLLPAVIYISFIQNRLPTLLAEYKQSLRRLGYPENSEIYLEKFNLIYGPNSEIGRLPFVYSPIIIASLLAFFGWLLVFFPAPGESIDLIPSETPLVYGFLGAYVFSLGSLVRQYATDDLQPRYYAGLITRYLTVFILSWLIILIVPKSDGGGVLAKDYLLAAFFIGLFPSTGLRIIQRLSRAILGIRIKGFQESQPLHNLEGLNAYHEDRLLLEGIENMQNLCSANIIDLMLKTRYPVEQLVDWIDQALLYLHTAGWTDQFKKSGLRTATDFLDYYNPPGLQSKELSQQRQDLGALLDSFATDQTGNNQQSHTLARLNSIATALRVDPNMFHVRYWRDHAFEALPEDVERSRTIADLKLMEGFSDQAIADYTDLLRTFPNYFTALLYRGLAHFKLGQYHQAIDDYTEVINRANRDMARRAYLWRGRVREKLKEYNEAAENYQEAIEKLGNDFPEGYLALAITQIYLREYDKAVEYLQFALINKHTETEALMHCGAVRYARWDQQGRSPETRASELNTACRELERARSLNPNLIEVYMNLATVFEALEQLPDAIQTLTVALQKLEIVPDLNLAYRVRLHRGNLYLKQGIFSLAADDYRIATQLTPNDAAAFFNYGIALKELEQFELAAQAFQNATRLNPGHALAFQELGQAVLNDLAAVRNVLDTAETAYSTALRLTRQAGDKTGEAIAHLSLGRLYRRSIERQDDAYKQLTRARDLAGMNPVDDLVYAQATYELGLIDLSADKLESASTLFASSAVLFDVLGEIRATVEANLQLGRTYLIQQNKLEACKILEEAYQEWRRIADPLNKDDNQLIQEIETELAKC